MKNILNHILVGRKTTIAIEIDDCQTFEYVIEKPKDIADGEIPNAMWVKYVEFGNFFYIGSIQVSKTGDWHFVRSFKSGRQEAPYTLIFEKVFSSTNHCPYQIHFPKICPQCQKPLSDHWNKVGTHPRCAHTATTIKTNAKFQ